MRRFALVLFALVILAGAIACQEGDEITNVTAPPPLEPVTIAIRGNCDAEVRTVLCCDDTDTMPAHQVDSVLWELLSSLSHVEAQTRGDEDLCVSFANVETGTYDVRQTVTATDGTTRRQTIPNVTVTGF